MQIDVRQMLLTISNAVDLVGVTDVFHGRRVAIMAVECARTLVWDVADQRRLFDAGLLHDCGVSSTRDHRKIIDQFAWEGASLHCEKGYDLLRNFAPLAYLAPIVRYHHTPWEEMTEFDVDAATARQANLIHLVDRVDALAGHYYADDSLLLHVGEIRNQIERHRGVDFAPDLVDAFLAASVPEAFWLILDPAYIPNYVDDMERDSEARPGTLVELKQFALLIASIVDAKSHFTAEHSLGVARLARLLGQMSGFSGDHLEKIEIAGLVHDIGKLQVPDEVLESPAAYTPAERSIMRRHSFATYQILRRIGGFEEIALWAGEHHESLNGSGYPFHLAAGEIPLEARLIKVADIFQALAQRRPYRMPMPVPEILDLLRKMQAENEVDGAVVDLVARHTETCRQSAVGTTESAESLLAAGSQT